MQHVVVTGASTGIGWGVLQKLAAKGFHVFGSVRRQEDAARLTGEFGDRFTPLVFDVTDEAAVAAAARQVAEQLNGAALSGLVNNAGISVPGPLLHLAISEFRQQIEVNLTGQLIVTQAFAPLLGADPNRSGSKGRIVMISSVAGRRALPFVGAYAASKFALEGLSESLRRELLLFGIDVVVIAPGPVVTKIWDKADAIDIARYADTAFAPFLSRLKDHMLKLGRSGLPAEVLGEIVHRALTDPTPKTRYVVTPTPMQQFLSMVMPPRMLDRMIARQLGFKQSARNPARS